jgi:hypothetical protein
VLPGAAGFGLSVDGHTEIDNDWRVGCEYWQNDGGLVTGDESGGGDLQLGVVVGLLGQLVVDVVVEFIGEYVVAFVGSADVVAQTQCA